VILTSYPEEIQVLFGSTNNGGNALIRYEYSLNADGPTYTNVSVSSIIDNTFTISGVDRSTSYTVYLRAVNARGNSVTSVSTNSVIPYTVPDYPIITYLYTQANTIYAGFTRPESNGGNSIISYEYSTNNGGSYYSVNVNDIANDQIAITNNIVFDQSYSVYLRAVNQRGRSTAVISPYTVTPVRTIRVTPDKMYRNVQTTLVYTNDDTAFYCIPNRAYQLSYNGTVLAYFSSPVGTGAYTFANVAIPSIGITSLSIIDDFTLSVLTTFTIPVLYENSLTFTDAQINAGNEMDIPGLTNGQLYTIFVTAINSYGTTTTYSITSGTPYTIPDPPTLVSTLSLPREIAVTFTPSSYNGGNTITYYEYSINNWTTSTVLTATEFGNKSFTISNLDRTLSYYVYLRSVNARGNSLSAVSTSAIIPYTIPDPPASVSLVSLPRQIDVSFVAPVSNGGNAIVSYWYSVDNEISYVGITPSSIVGNTFSIPNLTRENLYSVYLKVSNARGNTASVKSTNSVIPYTVPDSPVITSIIERTNSADVYYTAPLNGGNTISDYSYSVDGATYISMSRATDASFYTITGLFDGNTYSVSLKAQNARGNSLASAAVSVQLYDRPTAPIITSLISQPTAIDISFQAPTNNGGTPITNYIYYINDGTNTVSGLMNQTNNSVYRIRNLINGVQYSVYIVATNVKYSSPVSNTLSVIPYDVPSAPTITALSFIPRAIDISFQAPTNNGGNAITNYRYILLSNTGQITGLMGQATNAQYRVSNLTNGVTYSVYIAAVNARGDSALSNSLDIAPYDVPDAPVLHAAISSNAQIDISFSTPNNGGSDIIRYEYSINNGSLFTSMGLPSNNIYSITTGLSNGTSYSVVVRAISIYGNSANSNMIVSTPSTIPDAPILYDALPLNLRIDISFSTPYSGGNTISRYEYSIDNGDSFTNIGKPMNNKYNILVGLTNGITYYVLVRAVNSRGNSLPSNMILSTPFTYPDSPIINSILSNDRALIVQFTPADNGGNTNINYSYSINAEASYVSINQTTSPFTISGLTNGQSYTVYMKAENARGNSLISSSPQTATPYTFPSPPAIQSLVPLNKQIQVIFTAPTDNGGTPITDYMYSVGGGSYLFLENSITEPFIIDKDDNYNPLVNGTAYTIYMKAVNAGGISLASLSKTTTPFTYPDPPSIQTLTPLNQSITVAFTGPENTGGNAIINYSYSIDGEASYVSINQLTSPFTISDLTNGQSYTVFMKSQNTRGNSIASQTQSTTPFTYPDPPTIQTLVPLDRAIQVNFAAPVNNGGNTIVNYYYSIDNEVSYVPINQTTSPFTISGLTNAQSYTVFMKSQNTRGNSIASQTQSTIPFTFADPPTIQSLVPLDRAIQVNFAAPADNGGNAVINYSYSINNQATYISINQLTSPFTISDLTNGQSYTVFMKSQNTRGNSIASQTQSTIPYTIPLAPTIDFLFPLAGEIQVYYIKSTNNGGNSITEYRYSLDDANYISIGNPLQPVFTIPTLTNGQTYSVYMKSYNSRGNSLASVPKSATPYTVPDKPTLIQLVSQDSAIDISFSAPANTGGSPITNYSYSLNGGADVPIGYSTPLTYRVTSLANGTPYTIRIKAINARGSSESSDALTESPFGVPNSPFIYAVYANDGSADISFSQPNNNGNAIVDYSYSKDGVTYVSIGRSTTEIYRVSPLQNGTTYPITMKAQNYRGNSAPSAVVSVTPFSVPSAPVIQQLIAQDGAIDIVFTQPSTGGSPITNYKYALGASGEYQYMNQTTTDTFTITALTNAQPYTVYLKAENSRGESAASLPQTTTPYTVPNSPEIYELIALPRAIDISFSQPFNGGNTITDYEYSTDLRNFISMGQSTNAIYRISNLTDGQSYAVVIRAVNARGVSSASTPIRYSSPFSPPNSPVITNVATNDRTITITYTRPVSNGNAILYYLYSTDSITYRSTGGTALTYTITDVSNGVEYPVSVKAVNVRGESLPSTIVYATPYTVPSSPSIYALTPNDGSVDISFSVPVSNGGNAITDYVYSADGSIYTSMGQSTNAIYRITPLTNGVSYTISIKAVNARGASAASSGVQTIPYSVPNAPSIYRVIPNDGSLDISFSVPAFDGGNTITDYLYSTDGSIYTSMGQSTNALFRISPLTNGVSYTVSIKAVNARGISAASSSISAIPYSVPNAPSIYALTPNDGSVDISFSVPAFDGGNTITDYVYSTDGSIYTSMGQSTNALFRISPLTNGVSYTVFIKAVNERGASAASSGVQTIPYSVPNAPSIYRLTPNDGSVDISFAVPAFDGGNTITDYLYSTDGTTYASMGQSTNAIYRITPLTNGVSYTVFIKAVNARGNSAASSSISAIPYSVPNAPSIYALTPNDGSVDISFAAPVFNGGNPITDYLYSTDGSIYTSMGQSSNEPFRISPLTNGVSYTVFIKAVNARGNSAASSPISAIPYSVPGAPIIYEITPNAGSADVSFSVPAFDGGNAITDYLYSIDGAIYNSMGQSTNAIYRISPLDNGVYYTVFIKAVNARGNSAASSGVQTIPYSVPNAPSISRLTPNDGSVDISFAVPAFDGGNTITDYLYSTDGNTYISMGQSTNAIYRITPLTNGVSYTISIKAVNARGNSAASSSISAIPYSVPNAPSIYRVIPNDGSLDISFAVPAFDGGNAITNYKYSINNTRYISMGQSTNDIFRVPNLVNGISYPVSVKAVNARGDSVKSETIFQTPYTIPNPPAIISVLEQPGAIDISFSAPEFDGGNTITEYLYSVDSVNYLSMGQATTSTGYGITDLSDGQPYTITVKAVNSRGNSFASEPILATPYRIPDPPSFQLIANDGSADISYSAPFNGGRPINLYQYSVDGSPFTYMSNIVELFRVEPLVNAVPYTIRLLAYNARGNSAISSSQTVIPYRVPDAPTINTLVPQIGAIDISFSAPVFDGGNTITEYLYSVDGSTYITMGSATPSTGFRIPGLINGQTYTVTLRAVNARGNSAASSGQSTIPYRVPDAPTINTLVPQIGAIDVAFTAPAFDGGNTITEYLYSVDGSTYITMGTATPSTGFRIPDLINGQTYTVTLRAVNARGNSAASTGRSTKPYRVPDAPTIHALIPRSGTLDISFSAPAFDGGNTITDYTYSVDNAPFISMGQTSTALYRIYNLVDRQPYAVKIRAVNARGSSANSNELIGKPSTVPSPPTITELIPQIGEIDIVFTAPADDGGNPILDYEYSTNNGAFFSMQQDTTTNYTIRNRINGQLYSVVIRAVNATGVSASSNSVSTIPYDVPDAPVITSIEPYDQQLVVYYDPPAWNGGNSIVNYRYSVNNGVFLSLNTSIATPFTLTNRMNGVEYSVVMVADNARGESALSNEVRSTPRTVPNPPFISQLVPLNSAIQVNYVVPSFDGGNTITQYEYVINGVISQDTFNVLPYTITNLANGTPYTIGIYARNAAGVSAISNVVTEIPFTTPSKPTIVSVVPGDRTLTITFSGFNGGRTITTFKYSFNGSSYIYNVSPITNTIVITGLQNGVTNTFQFIAVNLAGDSLPSDRITATAYTFSAPPTITSVVAGNALLTVYFNPPANNGGNLISNYAYTYTPSGETYTLIPNYPYSFVIPNLPYGIFHAVKLYAINAAGYSGESNTAGGTPFIAPTPPTITSVEEGNTTLTVYFTKGDPRGSEITECAYWVYSYDSETQTEIITETILDTTESPFVITDLVNGFTYGIAVKNKNLNGYSDLSTRVNATPYYKPAPPVITSVFAENWAANIQFEHGDDGGRPITNVLYSLDGAPYISLGAQTFQIDLSELLNQNLYTVRIISVNSAGMSDPEEVSFTPYYNSVNVPLIKRRNTVNQTLSRREQYALVVRIDRGKTRFISNG
jgi:hypothetical protein